MSKSLATRLSRISLEKYVEQHGLDSMGKEDKKGDVDVEMSGGGSTTIGEELGTAKKGAKPTRSKKEKKRIAVETSEESKDRTEMLLSLVSQHMQDQPISELDIMAQFIYHVRNKDQELKWDPLVAIPSNTNVQQ